MSVLPPTLAGQHTPLCPAGHLPLKGGDWLARRSALIIRHMRLVPNVDEGIISPREGEMAGKPEGGMSRDSIKP
ncbi:hypothetical protein C7477_12010 [Phyllobacterium leguminum]|uniref:Lytic murein transglycosylase n=1 Tax=Phyllobacterium leguminum TaxID=314237 RepID=A0A318T1P3_9HYPH|nr:hypothetical protein C7477_12010 [Phyllobacterium leguminum]